jgi:hypothetical protein
MGGAVLLRYPSSVPKRLMGIAKTRSTHPTNAENIETGRAHTPQKNGHNRISATAVFNVALNQPIKQPAAISRNHPTRRLARAAGTDFTRAASAHF